MRIPDLIEPFIAWRVWDVALVDDGVLLESMYHAATWPPGNTLRATCKLGCREVPGAGDAHITDTDRAFGVKLAHMPCGIYAGKDLKQAADYLPHDLSDPTAVKFKRTRSVIGKVALFGVVKEHERGYRAELARPVALWVPVSFGFPVECWEGDPEHVARLLRDRYDVPVKLFRRIRDLEGL